jgi:AcrR family transcriptional regulator
MSAKERILDAAEAVCERVGAAGLTLDEVAREAGVSKGGLLYHFRSKEALAVAMIERFTERFDRAVEELAAQDTEPVGRITRAYIRATIGEAPSTGQSFDLACGSLTAVLANFPDKLAVVRAQSARWQDAIEQDGLDPVLASTLRLAIDGLWLGENFNLMRIDERRRKAIVRHLLEQTRSSQRPRRRAAS